MTTQIIVGVAPELNAPAEYFGAQNAESLRVRLTIGNEALILTPQNGPEFRWLFEDIRQVPGQADRSEMMLRLASEPMARLLVRDRTAIHALGSRCKNLRRRPPRKNTGKLLIWAMAALCSVGLIVFGLVPIMAGQLARVLPPEGEKALGDATFEQIRAALSDHPEVPLRVCQNPAGVEALEKMTARLTGQIDLPYPVEVHVLRHRMVNAFALPGGHAVLFDGLIHAAETPEEVAAVLAHELGHVVARDPARGALQSAGTIGVIGLLFGDFAGGSIVLFLTNQLVFAKYSKEAEALADAFARDLLVRSDLDPGALGDMFERMNARHGDTEGFIRHLATHPAFADRIRAGAEISGPEVVLPLLTEEEWQALRQICR